MNILHILRYVGCLTVFCLLSYGAAAQETAWYDNTHEHYKAAQDYYQQELYGQAIHSLDQYLAYDRTATDSKRHLTHYLQAQEMRAIAQMRLQLPEAERNLQQFIADNRPSPMINGAIFEMADYYYNEKQYASSIEYFDMIDIDALPELKMSELVFKKGYCYFVKKEFAQAQYTFSYSKDIQNKYFYPVNYYYGMCEYFGGDYGDAIKSFQRVENSAVYQSQIPYYICQIYFAEEKYDELINYGSAIVQRADTKKKKEIRLLLGQTYFQRNNFTEALPHLQYYEENTGTLTIEEFYQLAFTQYQLGMCEQATENFLEINLEDSKLGQVVNYYLADCYERSGDKQSARAAFKKVSQMDYDLGMQREATFNYGKLSAEMGLEREAINVLMNVEQSSPYYSETQSIINDILINTGDFENAIAILESIPNLSRELEQTYQKVTFRRAMQDIAEGDATKGEINLNKSKKYPYDNRLVAQSEYWLATMLADDGDYDGSIAAFNKYQEYAANVSQLPQEAASYMGHYNQGHNYLKKTRYVDAASEFKQAIVGINRDQDQITSTAIYDRVLPDAYLRAGDALFKVNRYDDAVTYYDQSIDRQAPGYVYALYQRGLIEGLVGEPYQKVITMEKITNEHPDSDYADDALLQLGDTYLALGNPIPAANAFRTLRNDYKGRSNLINAANLKLGLINYNEGDIEGSLAYYKSVFQNNPNPKESQEALIAIEEIYIDDLGKSDEYFNFLQTIPGYEISAFSKDSINYRIGEIQYQNGNYDRAITAFDDYLKAYSQGYYRLNARYFRGESLSLLKNYSRALNDYEVIIAEGFSDYYERATKKAAVISYNHNQDFDKAYKYYTLWEQQTQNLEDQYQAQMGVLRSAFRLGKDDGVTKYSNLVIGNTLASIDDKSTAHYYRAKVAYRNGQLSDATAAFRQVADLSNNNQAAESRYMLAKIAYDGKDLTAAESAANDANSKNKNYPTWIARSILLLADIYIDRGDLLNARAAVEAIIENFKSDPDLSKDAQAKLTIISQKEQAANRIKIDNPDGTLELDTTGN